jgi:hypothetical protein
VKGRKAKLILIGAAAVSFVLGAWVWNAQRNRQLYRVVSLQQGWSLRDFALTRGRDHQMWGADRWEMQLSRMLGRTAATRRSRPKLMRPIPWFRTTTAEPALGFIVRFRGAISDRELAALSARLVSGTNTCGLTWQSTSRDPVRGSFIKCWTAEGTPPTNQPIRLQIRFGSGAQLACIEIPTNRKEFAQPVYGEITARKQYVADRVREFLEGKRSARETLKLLHEFYEEYGSPAYVTVFEMIYYDSEGITSNKPGDNELAKRLRDEARVWLKDQF